MFTKQNYAEQIKAQTDIWKQQMKEYQEQLDQAGAKARAEYAKAMAQMEAKTEEATKLAAKIQGASESAWKDMQTASQKAFAELQRGWADALSRFQ